MKTHAKNEHNIVVLKYGKYDAVPWYKYTAECSCGKLQKESSSYGSMMA